ncbi:hypothetical protein GCM10007315_04660 [Gemmobacter tilapiae]|uniref:Uncharacterized protein n=2 Tax=Neogemmobacter tilapiae TaxID=875041 RepID=A0A918THB1_9RHOB|nr:hypothetical protein GCM10007315_04660 [Gemmobacter tilapiae]
MGEVMQVFPATPLPTYEHIEFRWAIVAPDQATDDSILTVVLSNRKRHDLENVKPPPAYQALDVLCVSLAKLVPNPKIPKGMYPDISVAISPDELCPRVGRTSVSSLYHP